jgi:antitoxin (DNA-binding transcriptional repressor) of toxin-antitoxin stability system
MTTLSITEAKKNLGKWLKAAGEGQEVGIIAGSRIFALRPVTVTAEDYAIQEYGVTREELERFADRAEKRNARFTGVAKRVANVKQELRKELEEAARHHAGRAGKTRRAAKTGMRRVPARAH